jgi:DNA-binding PadR family transcriptional regulator
MPGRKRYRNPIEVLQGALDRLILQTLQWGPQHGYGIARSIRSQSNELFRIETSW